MIIERIITVEYLAPSMAKSLLGKFPDNSEFGFNYSESGIWSPLLPRGRIGSDAFGSSSDKSRRTKGRRKMLMMMKKKKIGNLGSKKLDFSPDSATPKRGWNRLVKAVARRFKVQRRAAMQMMLPTL